MGSVGVDSAFVLDSAVVYSFQSRIISGDSVLAVEGTVISEEGMTTSGTSSSQYKSRGTPTEWL